MWGECLQVPLQLGNSIFPVNLLLLAIFGTNIILKVHWLAWRGPTLVNYKSLWMEFDHHEESAYMLCLICQWMMCPQLRCDARPEVNMGVNISIYLFPKPC